MRIRYLTASLIALLSWTNLAPAQVGLGTPVPNSSASLSGKYTGADKFSPASPYATYPSPNPQHDHHAGKPTYPILAGISKRVMTPIRAAAGHLMPPTPTDPIPTRDDIGRMITDGNYSPAEITAAKIKLDESQGRARLAAVRYLGTVDCHYYPEAEIGLIAALRSDRVEAVRYEAALAIGNCRAITARMLESLNISFMGGDIDGNPTETSDRVRAAVRYALDRHKPRTMVLPTAAPAMYFPYADPWMLPDPNWVQPVNYFAPTFLPMTPPVLQSERQFAETVSSQAPAPMTTPGPRPFQQFWQQLTTTRDSAPAPSPSVDPRLRGLTPLGSMQTTLALPGR